MDLKAQRAAAITAAQQIIQGAKAAGRPFTAEERVKLADHKDTVDRLSKTIEDADYFESVFAPGKKQRQANSSGAPRTALSFKGVGAALLTPEDGDRRDIKALLAEGSQVVPTSETDLVVLQERPSVNFMEAIPAQEVSENFSYLRQSARTNNAAPVAVGALKPTSVFTLERIEARLKVIAHLSEPVPEYWLKDMPLLADFINLEMVGGLAEAVADQFLNGDGTGENLAGVTQVSGIQTQAFVTDRIATARTALGQVETLGLGGSLFVLNPTDWMAIELTRTDGTTGGYLLDGAPVDRARRQLWGVPVALTTGVTAGTGYLFAEDSVRLFHDGQIEFKWGVIDDDFGRNQVRARAEGRFEAGAVRPSGIVEMTLTGA